MVIVMFGANSVNNIRITDAAYRIAKEQAEETGIHMCEWISKAIMDQALLEELVRDQD